MQPLLTLRNVTKKHFRRCILRDVNLDISPGRIIGLIGPNGSGKSSLLKAVAGLTRFSAGAISISGKPADRQRAEVAYMPDIRCFDSCLTLFDCLCMYSDFFADFQQAKAKETLLRYGLHPDMKLHDLSKGQGDVAALALTLARQARLYLLDEPFSAVDMAARASLMDMMLDHFDEDRTVIVATHLLNDTARIFDEMILMNDGSVVAHGTTEEVLKTYADTWGLAKGERMRYA